MGYLFGWLSGAVRSWEIRLAGERDPLSAAFCQSHGRVVHSPELERRVKTFQKWHEGHGGIVVQYHVEDGRLGVPEYAVEKLGVKIIEPKWGQGAKDIGGEVKLSTLERTPKTGSPGRTGSGGLRTQAPGAVQGEREIFPPFFAREQC